MPHFVINTYFIDRKYGERMKTHLGKIYNAFDLSKELYSHISNMKMLLRLIVLVYKVNE